MPSIYPLNIHQGVENWRFPTPRKQSLTGEAVYLTAEKGGEPGCVSEDGEVDDEGDYRNTPKE
jgi:outer membrane protein assembly factor BamB